MGEVNGCEYMTVKALRVNDMRMFISKQNVYSAQNRLKEYQRSERKMWNPKDN